ncbi:MAG: aspartate/glutamate racemase family protein [Candidatus Acidifodinimicrobium sp.]
MRIMIIEPVSSTEFRNESEEYFRDLKELSTEIIVRNLEAGPKTIETYLDVFLAAPRIAKIVHEEQENFDAFVIDCFADPGLDASREVSRKLVLGVAEVTMHIASMIAHKFSVITTEKNSIPYTEIQALNYSVKDRLNKIVSVDIGVEGLIFSESNYSKFLKLAREEMRDGSEAIVLGCTRMNTFAERLQNDINIPVLEPSKVTLTVAEALVKIGINHSRFLKYAMTQSKLESLSEDLKL